MPHPKGHVKLSGDTHLPDAESDLELERGRTGLAMLARERRATGRPAGGVRKAGLVTAPDGDIRLSPAATGRAGQIRAPTALLTSRTIRTPFWKEGPSLLKWAGFALGALLLVRLARH